MFPTLTPTQIKPGLWEERLAEQRDPLQRLAIIDQLAGHYAYTNVLRARQLLAEQAQLLEKQEVSDFKFHFYLNQVVVQNQLYEFEQAAQTALEGISYLESAGSVKELVEMYTEYAGVCIKLGQTEVAERYLDKAAKLLKNYPDSHLSSRIACRRGFLQLMANNYSRATELLLNALTLLNTDQDATSLKDEYFRTLIFSGLGQVYERNQEFQKSAQSYQRAVRLCEKLGMSNRLAWHYLNIGRAFMSLGQYDRAKEYLQRVIDTRDDLSLEARASAYANLGSCYLEEGAYEQALDLLDRAENLQQELNPDDISNLATIANWRGQIAHAQAKLETALKYYFEAIQMATALNNTALLVDLYDQVASVYAEGGDYEEAYKYQVEHDGLVQIHLEQLDKLRQQELEVRYHAAQKQQEAELLELKATRLQLKALRAQMNPHFIYNALNSIQNHITSNDPSNASRYLAKFAKLMRQSLEYSDEEIISLENELEFLEDYLFINKMLRFADRMDYQIKVDDELEEDILGVPTMIVQPYVENALEHGLRAKKDGKIIVHFSLWDEDTIFCIVEDNGIGRRRAQALQQGDAGRENYRSRGTQITEKRLELLRQSKNQEILVQTIDLYHEDGSAAGTRVEIKIPIVEIQVK
jgi:tetratricopeptide (TPR) repeat protein